MKKNVFDFIVKAHFVLRTLRLFLSCLDKKAKVNFKIHDVTNWETNNHNTAQHVKK